jgi:hypothetical protein
MSVKLCIDFKGRTAIDDTGENNLMWSFIICAQINTIRVVIEDEMGKIRSTHIKDDKK